MDSRLRVSGLRVSGRKAFWVSGLRTDVGFI